MLPRINQILHLQVLSFGDEEAKQEHKARIAEADDTRICIEIPINTATGQWTRLRHGDELAAYYVTEDGIKYSFRTTVIGFSEDAVRLVHLQTPAPESVVRVQRRQFVRVPANLELAASIDGQPQCVALTDNISGGGISFVCDKSISAETGQSVSCWLLMPGKNQQPDHIPFRCEIVRMEPLADSDKQRIVTRYSEIAEKDREKIIRYCFDRQLELRKLAPEK
ncbi:flagellar brake protein [Paenibacillus ginsengihumi]|uniref:flagellar brake protein n=1 Tax=Paenibacillus ginsengihumi TaxID=431596 RepID=UPI0003679554|nr:PilZ domain-containing protein [Paenibacillus ginsengihumi]